MIFSFQSTQNSCTNNEKSWILKLKPVPGPGWNFVQYGCTPVNLMQERQHSCKNCIEGITSVCVYLGTRNAKMNPKKVGLVTGGQVRKSKVRGEYTISYGSGISYMVFIAEHMLSTCTHVEYNFCQRTFILTFVFHMFFISKLCDSPLAVNISNASFFVHF